MKLCLIVLMMLQHLARSKFFKWRSPNCSHLINGGDCCDCLDAGYHCAWREVYKSYEEDGPRCFLSDDIMQIKIREMETGNSTGIITALTTKINLNGGIFGGGGTSLGHHPCWSSAIASHCSAVLNNQPLFHALPRAASCTVTWSILFALSLSRVVRYVCVI